jgi:hypothetical protein
MGLAPQDYRSIFYVFLILEDVCLIEGIREYRHQMSNVWTVNS